MDIGRLEEFTTLAAHGSFRGAAEALGISPALLSNHISLLEKRLGERLLERSAHSVALTEAGRRFLIDARDIGKEYRQLVSGIGSISESASLSIKIGFSGFIIPAKLGPYLDTVNLQYPNIRIELFSDRDYGIENGLSGGELDLFFSYAPEELFYPDIEKELIYSAKVLALVPQHHHLAHKSSLSTPDLEGERFVLYPRGADSSYRRAERAILDRSGISYSVYDGYVCPTAHYIMVPVGKGLALCPSNMRSMIPPNTTAIPVIDPNFEIGMYAFYRRDNPNSFAAEFLEGFRAFSKGGRSNDN